MNNNMIDDPVLQMAMHFLRENKDVALATATGGRPHIRVFQVMRVEGTRLFFATSRHKAVWRELAENPRVELLGYNADVSVRCSGSVCFDVDDAIARWIFDNNPVLPRLYPSCDALAYFSLQPDELAYYDLRRPPCAISTC